MDEGEAIDYLLSNHPEWRGVYSILDNHWAAMTVVAADLSKDCGLDVYADSIWIGGGCEGLGMVFKGVSIGNNVRTPEDTEKLRRLEKILVELKFVTTPKLGILCSSSFLDHIEEPLEMALLPTPADILQPSRIIEIMDRWRRVYNHQRREKKKARQEEGGAKSW